MSRKQTIRIGLTVGAAALVAIPLAMQVRHAHGAGTVRPVEVAVAPPPGDADLGQALADKAPPTSQPGVDPKQVVLTIGDEKLTAEEFQQIINDLPAQVQAQVAASPSGRRSLAEQVIDYKLLSDEAKRRKLDQTRSIQLRLDLKAQDVLADALMRTLGDDEAADQKFYNEHKTDFDQVKARHILIATSDSTVPAAKKLSDADAKAKATAIRARLVKGEDFATIAKKESDDTQSGAEGGSLGTFGRGQMVPSFEAATFALKKGEISEPVRTQFGYHVIQAVDRVAPPFADVRRDVSRARLQALIEDLKKQQEPVLNETYFGKNPTPATKPAETQPDSSSAGAPAEGKASSGKSSDSK